MHSFSPVRIPKLQLAAEQPSTGECWIPPKKDAPCQRAKEKPQQDAGGAKFRLESNPYPPETLISGLCVHAHQVVNFFHSVGVLASV